MEFNRTYMKIHDMWKDLGWRIIDEFEAPENPNELVWYACHMDGETLQKVLVHGMKIKNKNINSDNNNENKNNTEVEKVEAEIVTNAVNTPVTEAEIPLEDIEAETDNGLSVEISHDEAPKSEFEVKVSTCVFIGTKIEDAFEATDVSFIDYHYLYLIGDTAREMERQLDKMEYVETPDHSDDSNVSESETESTSFIPTDDSIVSDVSETNDSDKAIIDGIEVSKKEEQSLLEGEF